MLNNKTKHRRNHSQHPAPPVSKKTTKNKLKQPTKKSAKGLDSQLVHQLLHQSNNKSITKQVLIEDLDEDVGTQENDEFFQFGRKTRNFQTARPRMEEIVEVPDTGSYSQRNTQSRGDNKENVKDYANQRREERYSRLNSDHTEHLRTKQAHSHRVLYNCSKRSTSKSNRSHDCSQSTVELKGRKGRAKSCGKGISKSNKVLQKQVNMLWECIGDIWVRNRAMQKRVEVHEHCIQQLARRSEMYVQELMSLKLECKSGRS